MDACRSDSLFSLVSLYVSMSPCYVIRRSRAPRAGCCAMCFVNQTNQLCTTPASIRPLIPFTTHSIYKLPASPSTLRYKTPRHIRRRPLILSHVPLCWLRIPPLCSRAAHWAAPPRAPLCQVLIEAFVIRKSMVSVRLSCTMLPPPIHIASLPRPRPRPTFAE